MKRVLTIALILSSFCSFGQVIDTSNLRFINSSNYDKPNGLYPKKAFVVPAYGLYNNDTTSKIAGQIKRVGTSIYFANGTYWERFHDFSSITSTNISNWNTAFNYGPHAGLYPTIQRFLDSVNNKLPNVIGINGQVPVAYYDYGTNTFVAENIVKIGPYVRNDQELDRAKTQFVPQSDVFHTWERVSFGGSTPIPAGGPNTDSIPGVPAQTNEWAYDSIMRSVSSTANSGSFIGFVSPQKYSSYTLGVTFNSSGADDDYIASILAFMKDSTHMVVNHAKGLSAVTYPYVDVVSDSVPDQNTLSLIVSRSSSQLEWAIVYNYRKLTQTTIVDGSLMPFYHPNSFWSPSNSIDIKVIRENNTFRVSRSEFSDYTTGKGPLKYDLAVDLTSNPLLYKFIGSASYGYGALSQANASFTNITFSNTANTIYDVRGPVYNPNEAGDYSVDNTVLFPRLRRFYHNPTEGTWMYVDESGSVRTFVDSMAMVRSTDSLTAHNTRILTNTNAINANTASITANTNSINTNTTAINANTTAINSKKSIADSSRTIGSHYVTQNQLITVADSISVPLRDAVNFSAFSTKYKKLEVGSDSSQVLYDFGNSIQNRLYNAEMSATTNTANAPPYMYRQNIGKTILDNLQFPNSDLTYFPAYNKTGFTGQSVAAIPSNSSFITLAGTWTDYTNNDFEYYKETSTAASNIIYSLGSGFKFADLIVQREDVGATSVVVTVSVNSGAYTSVATAGLTGVESFSTLWPNSYLNNSPQRQYHVTYRGLNPANTYSFKLTNSGTGTFRVWGFEAWERFSLRVIVAGQGGATSSSLYGRFNNYFNSSNTNVNIDGIIYEYPILNDSYNGAGIAPTTAMRTNTQNYLDSTNIFLRNLQKPVLGMVPHGSSPEPSWYSDFATMAINSAKKNGIQLLDFYHLTKNHAYTDMWADGTHLNDSGVHYSYYPIYNTIINGVYYDTAFTLANKYQLDNNYWKYNGNTLAAGGKYFGSLNNTPIVFIAGNTQMGAMDGTTKTWALGHSQVAFASAEVTIGSTTLGNSLLLLNSSTSAGTAGVNISVTGSKVSGLNYGARIAVTGSSTTNGGNIGIDFSSSMTAAQTNYLINSHGALAQTRFDGSMIIGAGLGSTNFAPLYPSAVLQLENKTKGFLPPRMTTAERDAIDVSQNGIVSLTVVGGSGYTTATASVSSGTTAAQLELTITAGVISAKIAYAGLGYTIGTTPTVALTTTGGSGASITPVVGNLSKGLVIYNTDMQRLNTYNGTAWTYGPLVSTGTAAPTTTPVAIGDKFEDTTNKKSYVATGTSSSADWTILN